MESIEEAEGGLRGNTMRLILSMAECRGGPSLIELRSEQVLREEDFHTQGLAPRTMMRKVQRSGVRLTCGDSFQPHPLELLQTFYNHCSLEFGWPGCWLRVF